MKSQSLLLCGVLVVAACNPFKRGEPASVDAGPLSVSAVVEQASADPMPSAIAPPAAKGDPNWIPSNGDDEAQAKRVVTHANYKSELDSVAKEIEAEGAGTTTAPLKK